MTTFKIPELDKMDVRILELLQQNGDYTPRQLGALLNKSHTAIYDRIRALKQKEYIRYSVTVNKQKIPNLLTVYTQVQLNEHSSNALDVFQEMVTDFEEVMECYHMTGSYDFKLKIIVPDMAAYNQFLRTRLSAIPNLGAVESYFVIAEHKHETALKLG
ncbi:Lrp/AsnC family transcriptional regulator [Pedobacter metabolipauper]|uniref:AsnC family transcriptional regulator n=1 Tax=Pedobacter metabolipauper TaxID=425513 RepID=A0A4R6SR52_9SPHI|nr:Lrp/AsnC family transcriptional regulator [Pedobacter metabolipauper]TDQ06902.1 AsnC family transcriptional regulator [Pedobacter metabolipauper]